MGDDSINETKYISHDHGEEITSVFDLSKDASRHPPAVSQSSRADELDGVRGWASLAVVGWHMFYGVLGDPLAVRHSLMAVALFNGPLAVMIFFVLSGEALTFSYLQRGDASAIARTAVKRYPRLAIPTFAASLLTFAILFFGISYSWPAAIMLGAEHKWLGSVFAGDMTIARLLEYALIDVFVSPYPPDALDPFLWTMVTEARGSVMIVGLMLIDLLWLRQRPKIRVYGLIALAVAAFAANMYLACFLFGMLFGLARRARLFGPLQLPGWWNLAAIAAIAAALLVCADLTMRGFYPKQIEMLAAPFILLCIQLSPPLRLFCGNRLSSWLGRISFPLYLVHYQVIISLMSGLIVLAGAYGQATPMMMLAIGVTSAASALTIAWLFLPIERLAITSSDRLSKMCRRVAD